MKETGSAKLAEIAWTGDTFPQISYEEFARLSPALRQEIILGNRVISTDTYNRSMNHYKGLNYVDPETYVLQMRVTPPNGYMIVCGVRKALERTIARPILEAEVDFAAEFYKNHAQIPYFNEQMWRDVLDKHGGRVPLEINALPDGTSVLAGDPIMIVSGPGELAAHFEAQFHRVFYHSLVATDAHRISQIVGDARRFIEVGKRGTPNEQMHLDAMEAAYIGGGLHLTSNDMAAALHPELRDVGTMGHRFVQFAPNETEAFEQAINATNSVSLLIDLIDSFKGIEKAMVLKQKYRESGKKIWIRLDSGDIKKQTIYILEKYRELGFTDPAMHKVVVEDLDSIEQIAEFEKDLKERGLEPDKYVIYGAGGIVVTKNKERNKASTGYKLSAVGDRPKIKLSSSPGKESLPGRVRLVRGLDGQRIIEQFGEIAVSNRVLGVFDKEQILKDNMKAARGRVDESFADLMKQRVWQERVDGKVPKTPLSALTRRITDDLRAFYIDEKMPTDLIVYPNKIAVPDDKVSWNKEWAEYDPPYFVHDNVLKNDVTINPKGWADPEDLNKLNLSFRESSEVKELRFDKEGRPMNPRGRKGLAGRGLLGKWGPNQAADTILTYRDGDKLKLLVIKRKDTGNLAFPGGFLDKSELPEEAALREIQEEAFCHDDKNAEEADLLGKIIGRARLVRAGYMDDYRNTDNAWIEGSAFFAELTRDEFEALKPQGGDDAAEAMWMDVSQESLSKMYIGHIKIFQKLHLIF